MRKLCTRALVLLLVVGLMVAASGCGQTSSTETAAKPATPAAEQPSAAPAAPTAAPAPASQESWPKNYSIATCAVGCALAVYATAFQQIADRELGTAGSVEVSGGAAQNVFLVNEGKAHFGGSTTPQIIQAMKGEGFAEGNRTDHLRAVVPVHINYLHLIAMAKSNISTIDAINGRVFSPGPRGGVSGQYGDDIIAAVNLKPKRVFNAGWADIVQQLKDGNVDAVLGITAAPLPAFAELATVDNVTVFVPNQQENEQLKARLPGFIDATIDKGKYRGHDTDLQTIGAVQILYTHENMPADMIYAMTKAAWDNKDEISGSYVPNRDIKDPEIMAAIKIPIHPGAIRYYEEIGVKLPPEAYPPEAKRS